MKKITLTSLISLMFINTVAIAKVANNSIDAQVQKLITKQTVWQENDEGRKFRQMVQNKSKTLGDFNNDGLTDTMVSVGFCESVHCKDTQSTENYIFLNKGKNQYQLAQTLSYGGYPKITFKGNILTLSSVYGKGETEITNFVWSNSSNNFEAQ